MPDGDWIISVPKQDWDGGGRDMRSRLQTWEWRWKPPPDRRRALIDFRGVEFLEPWALAMFTAYGLSLRQQTGLDVEPLLDDAVASNRYLRSMGVAEVLRTGRSIDAWDDDRRNTGLHVIRSHEDVTRFVRSATQLGRGPDDETMDALKYGMTELGRNVVQHADSPVGGVAIAQFFPDRNSLQIVICDSGRGVREALRHNYPEIAGDLEALKLAVLPHVSGAQATGPYSASDNAGLGLFFCKEIAWRAGGTFWLASQRALLGVIREDDAARHRVYRRIESWPGTVVAMDFPADGVVDFGGLLMVCQNLAAQARMSPGQAALDALAQPPDEIGPVHSVRVAEFLEDVGRAAAVRDGEIRPRVLAGESLVLDFGGARFVTQSFAHALLYDVFKIPGSLGKLMFVNCSGSTVQAIRTVAAYAATYRMKSL